MLLVVAESPPCRSRGADGTSQPPGPRPSRRPPRQRPGQTPGQTRARFLQRYEASDGRVVRRDQGGDTVSEGQGYAMLLAVAIGDRRQFAAAWRWDQTNLQLPNALFAYHWSRGRVVSTQSATDADLDTAWALVLASQRSTIRCTWRTGCRWRMPSWPTRPLRWPGAAAGGRAVGPVQPGRGRPELLRRRGDGRTGERDGRSTLVRAGRRFHRAGRRGDPSGRTLPSDWVDIQPDGVARAVGDPGTTASTPSYGLDAQRVPVWFAAGCTQSERAVAADAWPLLRRAAGQGARISYSVAERPNRRSEPARIGGRRGLGQRRGRPARRRALFAAADRQSARLPDLLRRRLGRPGSHPARHHVALALRSRCGGVVTRGLAHTPPSA